MKLRKKHISDALLGMNRFPNDPEFCNLVRNVEAAVRAGIHPQMISQGSSGSYFSRNEDSKIVGVFKPRNEEPFAHLNPKWMKYIQKVCSPCCFGRSCLLANQGYLSEAGASLVDTRLGLEIVPKTKVVQLSSSSFYYTKADRKKHILPSKVGSFQFYVDKYEAGGVFLRRMEEGALPPVIERRIKVLLQKMITLDYIIRNTDRSNENWLVKFDWPKPKESPSKDELKEEEIAEAVKGETSHKERTVPVEGGGDILLAAIDNGLAFPFKHPDQWRHYPFYWNGLKPFCDEEFSDEIKDLVLPKIDNPGFVETLQNDLFELFKMDPAFERGKFERQMGVMRGQVWNLRFALHNHYTPQQLASLPLRIGSLRRRRRRSGAEAEAMDHKAKLWEEVYRIQEINTGPCFSCC